MTEAAGQGNSPPLDEGLNQASVALGGRQVQQGHSPEADVVHKRFRTEPAGLRHHLLTQGHDAVLEGVGDRLGGGRQKHVSADQAQGPFPTSLPP